MARNKNKLRWDYYPCQAAIAAFHEARLSGETLQQSLDRLIVMGIYAIRSAAAQEKVQRPAFADPNRHYWRDDSSGTLRD